MAGNDVAVGCALKKGEVGAVDYLLGDCAVVKFDVDHLQCSLVEHALD